MPSASLERAIEIAVLAHSGQRQRNGLPYILHPLHVMFSMDRIEDQIVAVLHDVVEDSDWTLQALEREGFSPAVLDALRLLVREDAVDYEAYIERLADNPIACRVKLADLNHNLDTTRLPKLTQKDTARLEKYHRARLRLKQACQR